MDWIVKALRNRNAADDAMKWSNNHKVFQVKIDRELADDFKVICARLGKSQKMLVVSWMEQLVLDFKRGVLS